MQSSIRRATAVLVGATHLLVATLVVLPANALAQSDGEPPTIEFERSDEGVRGDAQVFSATVTDDVGIDSVILHYRLDETATYESLAMEPLIGTDIFTVLVETAGTDSDVLQYYIEARDAAGNRSIQGFAFDPIERRLVDPPGMLVTAPPLLESEADGMSTQRKVLYGVLGVLAVGALAAAAGGGGGSNGDAPAADDPGTIPLDIVVNPLR